MGELGAGGFGRVYRALQLSTGQDVEAEILRIAACGDVVFTERIDRMTMAGKKVVLPCAGVFEIRDGKIAAWRDYFDLATWQRQTA